jgi:hypothetical protein
MRFGELARLSVSIEAGESLDVCAHFGEGAQSKIPPVLGGCFRALRIGGETALVRGSAVGFCVCVFFH